MVSTYIFAQDADKPTPGQTNQTNSSEAPKITQSLNMKGKFGVYAYTNSSFTPENFIGGSVGAKYFLTNRIAIRGGASYHNSSITFDHPLTEEFVYTVDSSPNGPRRRGALSANFGANAYALYYPLSLGKFSFYAGAGAVFNLLTKGGRVFIDGVQVNDPKEQTFGVGGIVGTEYNLLRKLNLTLEYNPTLLFGDKHNEPAEQPDDNHYTPRHENFNASNVNLGVIYYFN